MFIAPLGQYLIFLLWYSVLEILSVQQINTQLTKIWGPGLEPHIVTMPARYFFIQLLNDNNESVTTDLDTVFSISFEGNSKLGKPCRIWSNMLNRKDGSYIIRYKLYETCYGLQIVVKYENTHMAKSPYVISGVTYPDDCDCPQKTIDQFLNSWKCGTVPKQITSDLSQYADINWNEIRTEIIKKFDQPHSVSLCHYVIKKNNVYRKCYGKYVGFKMFVDSILLSIMRKVMLPDLEMFVNLGDWPLVTEGVNEKFPIFSWCGSSDSRDIIMPTYDITESTLENMGRVMLDMLSVQGNVKKPWEERIPKAFWRGRDSNQHRLDLIDISRQHLELFNVSLTNFFFFRDKQEQYGPKTDHVSFFDFFDYKYQLSIDGTVAAYRLPYLLAGGSLVFKQESKYYEHFYKELESNVHYIPVKRDLSDLVSKLNWAINNDQEARSISLNGQKFANQHLLPQHIFCYYVHLTNEFSKRFTSKIEVFTDMERLEQVKQNSYCDCGTRIKDEL